MVFISLVIAVAAVLIVQAAVYRRRALSSLGYSVKIDADEVWEGSVFTLREEMTNEKALPLPLVRANTDLPDGLSFLLYEDDGGGGWRTVKKSSVQSVFSLRGEDTIRRSWRISADRRGVYTPDGTLIIVGDLTGSNSVSRRVASAGRAGTVTVLPRPVELERYFAPAHIAAGDIVVPRSLTDDPMLHRGVREYAPGDPMNRINWKASAREGGLRVNLNEFTERNIFNVVLNMQSRDYEQDAHTPATPDFIEMNISVCAAVFELCAAGGQPVRFFANTTPASVDGHPAGEDETGRNILRTQPFCGRGDTLAALRLLAALKYDISIRAEKMLAHIAQNPRYYSDGGSIIIITSYLNDDMTDFARSMRADGVRVVFYLTTTHKTTSELPEDIEIYYKLYK